MNWCWKKVHQRYANNGVLSNILIMSEYNQTHCLIIDFACATQRITSIDLHTYQYLPTQLIYRITSFSLS